MDINQSRPRHETHTCNDCGKKGHLSQVCPKPQKQRIWLTKSADTDIKSLIAKVVMATMLIYLGAMGKFIDIYYVQSNNLCTQHPPIYNIDGTPNEAGYITEVVDLIVKYKSHSE